MIILVVVVVVVLVILAFNSSGSQANYKHRPDYYGDEDFISDAILRNLKSRRGYYRDVYLKSKAWKRKRYVVLKRDNWRCVYCGGHATQVHHLKYAKRNIGKEPIEWLVSVCESCHNSLHH